MHLSQTNNDPALVRRELSAVLAGSEVSLAVASQQRAFAVGTGEGANGS